MNEQIKLLVITNALAKGGAEKLIETTIPLLKLRGMNITLLLLNQSRSVAEYIKSIEEAGVTIVDLGLSSYYEFSAIKKIKRFIANNQFDIIHVHLFPSLYWSGLAFGKGRFKNTRLVYTEHSNRNKRRGNPVFKIIDRFIYSRYHHIIAITEEVKRNLVQWIGNENKISVIKNGVDLKRIRMAPVYSKKDLSSMLQVQEDRCFLLMAASFRYPKDQVTLIRACSLLGDHFHVLLAGEGETMDEVKRQVQELGMEKQVHFLGFRNDIASLMKSVDINILSSHYEGLSGVTLEALASGRPFLGSDVPGINDVVPDNNYLFEKANAEELAQKIWAIYKQPSSALGLAERGLEYAKLFDIQIMVAEYMGLYKLLLRNPASL